MPAHVSSLGPPAGLSAWQELEEVLAELGALTRARPEPGDFYRRALELSVRALSAVGGAVWLRGPDGRLKSIAQLNWPAAEFAADPARRSAHEAVLASAAEEGRIITVAPGHAPRLEGGDASTDCVLLIAPVRAASASSPAHGVQAWIELLAHPHASPSVIRGYEQYLAALVDLASDYHAFRELDELRQIAADRDQFLRLAQAFHQHLDRESAAYCIANDGRRAVGCDRLTVLYVPRRGAARLLASSGAQTVERRSAAARSLEALAMHVGRTGEAAYYVDGETDALPQIAAALELHAEDSHARQIAAVPVLRRPAKPDPDSCIATPDKNAGRDEFVLIAEQFDARGADLQRLRLVEVAQLAATALANADAVERLPLVWLLRPLGAWKRSIVERWSRAAAIACLLAACVAALFLLNADFTVEATGTLQPVVRRAVFAPRNGLVEELLVKHGDDVAAGQPLLVLRDPVLELEIKRVHGELETTLRQIEAVRAAKTGRAIRDANAVDTYRLSAEERELDQRLTNLRRELELLNDDAKKLVVASPIGGRVLTWDLTGRLHGRPVERGEEMVAIADFSGPWQLELNVPDDRIGYVLAASREHGSPLAARFRLSSDQGESPPQSGHITDISHTADLSTADGARPAPTVRVTIALDKDRLSLPSRDELRPGISARAQISCGRKPLGYVWLHDVWDSLVGWLRF